MAKQKTEKLNDSINVPLRRSLKKRLVRLCPEDLKPTKFARLLLQGAVERGETAGPEAMGMAVEAVASGNE